MATWSKWFRRRGDDTPDASTRLEFEGRKLLGQVMDRVRGGGLSQYSRTIELPDGTVLTASYDGVTPVVTVVRGPTVVGETTVDRPSLWIPRGFVVYPSSDTSPAGWGTPVVQVGTSIFDTRNIAPGLDVTRWTTGGNLGEVIISPLFNNGYPDLNTRPLPLLYDTYQAPPDQQFQFPPVVPWQAYRVQFDDFTHQPQFGGTAMQSLFNTLNVGQQYNPPIRGYGNIAQYDAAYITTADYAGSPWLTDGVLSAAPSGYKAAADRKSKDGTPDVSAIDTVTNATGTDVFVNLETEGQLIGGPFTQPRTCLNLASGNGNNALTVIEHAQWIAAGVRYWIPPVASNLPILSWDGYPSWNWNADLILGVPVGATFQNLDWYTHVVRGATTKIFSTRLCANGREIGRLPAFVIAAGIQSHTVAATLTSPAHLVDRIVVLTWQLSDQDASTGDFNRVLRVWFRDVPRRNNVPLSLDHAVIGAYDATSNTGGWHYADKLQMWAGAVGIYQGFLQPPVFSPDGTRVVAVVAAFDVTYIFFTAYVPETVFSTINDGTLGVTTAILDTGGTSWSLPRAGHTDPNGKYPFAVDYQADSLALRAVYYADSVEFPTTDIGPVMRWTGDPSQTGALLTANDLPLHNDDADNFTTAMLFVQDPLTGTMFLVDQHVINPTTTGAPFQFRFRVVRNSTPQVTNIFPDANNTGLLSNEVITFLNDSNRVLPCFGRDVAGNYIAGYQMCPGGTTEGTHFDSNIGDLPTLTQTPGTSPCFYPIGVV